jgi:hypothetical protein
LTSLNWSKMSSHLSTISSLTGLGYVDKRAFHLR